jgi:hypothetical protein
MGAITGISHLYFETNSYGKTKEFWESLGAKLTIDLTRPDHNAGLFKIGNLTLMIKEIEGAPESGIFFSMDDAKATAEKIKNSAVKVRKDLFNSHWGTQLIEIEDADRRSFFLESSHE